MSDTQSPSTTAEHPPEEVRLAITGMTCASCSARIERKLAKVAGVQSATVNLATEKAQVRFSAPVTVDAIVAEVQKTGYGASVLGDAKPHAEATSHAGPIPGAGDLLHKLQARYARRDTRPHDQAHTPDDHGDHLEHTPAQDVLKPRLVVAIALTVPVLLLAMVLP